MHFALLTRGVFLFYHNYVEKIMVKDKIKQEKENRLNIGVFLASFVFTVLFFVFSIAMFNRQSAIILGIKNDIQEDLQFLKVAQMSDKDNLNKQLVLLREELIKYKSQQEGRDQILGLATINKNQGVQNQPQESTKSASSTTSLPDEIKGIVQLKKNWQSADVFEAPKASSKIIGQIVPEKIYFIYAKEAGWYKVDYKISERGWVQASLIDQF